VLLIPLSLGMFCSDDQDTVRRRGEGPERSEDGKGAAPKRGAFELV
jgi:hypothetical protein